MEIHNIYTYQLKDIAGKSIQLSNYTGKKILIVNTASECGYTVQYGQLQELYKNFNKQLEIIACPCNQFGNQEPGTAAGIQQFCSVNYGITFTISSKINVTGDAQHPLFQYLTKKALNGVKDTAIEWNFFKFLINEDGQMVDSYPSAITPLDECILTHLQTK